LSVTTIPPNGFIHATVLLYIGGILTIANNPSRFPNMNTRRLPASASFHARSFVANFHRVSLFPLLLATLLFVPCISVEAEPAAVQSTEKPKTNYGPYHRKVLEFLTVDALTRASYLPTSSPSTKARKDVLQKDLEAISRKKYLVIYWASWYCPPCHEKAPAVMNFIKKNQNYISALYLPPDAAEKNIKDYVKKFHITFPIVKPDTMYSKDFEQKFLKTGGIGLSATTTDGSLVDSKRGASDRLQNYIIVGNNYFRELGKKPKNASSATNTEAAGQPKDGPPISDANAAVLGTLVLLDDDDNVLLRTYEPQDFDKAFQEIRRGKKYMPITEPVFFPEPKVEKENPPTKKTNTKTSRSTSKK
jgi:thiol-disulfide isomerase/thioredoxin